MTRLHCDRCNLPARHLLAGDCVKALRRRITEMTETNNRLRTKNENYKRTIAGYMLQESALKRRLAAKDREIEALKGKARKAVERQREKTRKVRQQVSADLRLGRNFRKLMEAK